MNFRDCIREAFEEILERMVFLYFQESDEGDFSPAALPFVTEIAFHGAVSGRLNLALSPASAEEVARNLLGIREEDDLHPGVAEDAICEFTNMIVGRAMALVDPDQEFQLGIPAIAAPEEPALAGDGGIQILGQLEEQPCRITVTYAAA